MWCRHMVAWRVGEDLINGIKFRAQELACFSNDTASSINSKAVAVHDYLANTDPVLAANEDELCQMFGYTRRAYEQVLLAEGCQPTEVKKPEQQGAKESAEQAPDECEEVEDDEGPWLENLPNIDEADEPDDDVWDDDYDDYDDEESTR